MDLNNNQDFDNARVLAKSLIKLYESIENLDLQSSNWYLNFKILNYKNCACAFLNNPDVPYF